MTSNPFDQTTTEDSAFARFAAGDTGTDDTTTETPPQKAAPLDPTEVRAKLLLYTLQFDTSAVIGSIVKTQKDEDIDKLVERASDELGVSQFTVQAPTTDGQLEEVSKISVNRTKPETKITSEPAVLDWATNHRPDLTETTKRISPHTDPKVLDAMYTWLEQHHPEAVEEVTTLKPNALPTLINDGKIDGENLVVEAPDIDPATGELTDPKPQPVPGIRHDKGGAYKGFTLTHGGKGQPNQKKALALLMEGRIEGTDFRRIMAGAQEQLEAKK